MATSHRLNSFPSWMTSAETLSVLEALTCDGFDSPRFVGGSVRDSLVNRYVCDIDIATPLTPKEVIECLKEAKIKYVPTGIEHGTITAIVDKVPFEITTLRKDIETDGRHAKVVFTDNWEEDASRRDFTMNALFCDDEGRVYDYFNGVHDLHKGIVKFIGSPEDRIAEDVLRILRFFRFYAHYGRGDADKEALRACQKFASKISSLSKERITYEFLKMLQVDNTYKSCEYMQETNVIAVIFKNDVDVKRLENLITLEKEFDTNSDVMRRLFALTNEIPSLFCLSNIQKKHFKKLSEIDDISSNLSEKDLRKLVYELGNDILRDIILLSASKDMGKKMTYKELYQKATACRLPKFQLIGDDVLTLGIKQGKQVGEALKAVEIWWANNDFIAGRTDCLIKLKKVVTRMKAVK